MILSRVELCQAQSPACSSIQTPDKEDPFRGTASGTPSLPLLDAGTPSGQPLRFWAV